MALYKKSQLAELLGKKTAWVSTYVRRGKLTMRGDWIDDTIEENSRFIEKWLAKKVETDNDLSLNIPKTPKPEQKKYPDPEVPLERVNNIPPQELPNFNSLERIKDATEIRRKESVIALNELRARKMRGELLPADIVMNLFIMLAQQFQSNYKNGANHMIMEISHKAKLPAEVTSEMRTLLTSTINNSHKSAVSQTKKQLETLIADLTEQSNAETDE